MDKVQQASFNALVGEWFRTLRLVKKQTLRDLANQSGIHYTRLHRIERKGDIQLPEFLMLCEAHSVKNDVAMAVLAGFKRCVLSPTSEALWDLMD